MASYIACTTYGICAFLTDSGPFLGLTKITYAIVATGLKKASFKKMSPAYL